jgi:hypothetical protein
MGVFRIKENVDDFFEKDPFDLLTMDASASPRIGKKAFGIWSSIFGGILLAVVVASAAFFAMTRESRSTTESPYAYFEIRVIGPDGRPAVGASVRDGKKYLGVTDSFGEWRRFMRVRLGSSILLQLEKKSVNGTYFGSKSLAIPMLPPKKGDLEIKGSVQLEPEGGKAAREKRIVGLPPQPSSPEEEGAAQSAASLSSGQVDPAVKISDTDQQGAAVDQGSVWFETEIPNSATLLPLIDALKRRALELGLRVTQDSPWRLRLTDHSRADARLVQVEAFSGNGAASNRLFSFLRVPGESLHLTARDILWAATLHAEKSYAVTRDGALWRLLPSPGPLWGLSAGKVLFDPSGQTHAVITSPNQDGLILSNVHGDPCKGASHCFLTSPGTKRLPPVAGWQLLSLRLFAGAGDVPQVYVSGYEAHPREANLYEYWGAPEAAANITVIRSGRVTYRGRIQAKPGIVPMVHLPSQPVARATTR